MDSRPAKKSRLVGPELYRPIIAEAEKSLAEKMAKIETAKAEVAAKLKLAADAKASALRREKRALEAKKRAKAAEEEVNQARMLTQQLEKDATAATKELGFLHKSSPRPNAAEWRQEAKSVRQYCSSSTPFFKPSGEQAVMNLILKGHAALRKAEERTANPPTWLNKLYEQPALLELIGADFVQLNAQLLSIGEYYYEALFNKNVLKALREELVSSDELAKELCRYTAETRAFERTDLFVTFTTLFDRGLSLLRTQDLTMEQYFSNANPIDYLENLLRVAAEVQAQPSASYKPNRPITPSFGVSLSNK